MFLIVEPRLFAHAFAILMPLPHANGTTTGRTGNAMMREMTTHGADCTILEAATRLGIRDGWRHAGQNDRDNGKTG